MTVSALPTTSFMFHYSVGIFIISYSLLETEVFVHHEYEFSGLRNGFEWAN